MIVSIKKERHGGWNIRKWLIMNLKLLELSLLTILGNWPRQLISNQTSHYKCKQNLSLITEKLGFVTFSYVKWFPDSHPVPPLTAMVQKQD